MASGLYNWSQTAATNSGSDSAINWAEGQAPSSVNDSARAMMAVIKKHDDDIAGAIVTGGTSTAYTVTTYSVFDTLAHMDGQTIAFTPHATNGATVTLNADGLGAKPLRSAPSVELLAGTLIEGTPYTALYNHSDQVFYLHGFFGNPYNVPLGAGMDYWLPTAPNSSFVFPIGQAISRITYATLFAAMGTTHGVGDGSTTFNLPDKTGRVSAMKEATATRLTSTYFVGDSTAIGAVGGSQSHTITAGESAVLTYTNSVTQGTYLTAANKSSTYNNGSQTAAWNSGDTSATTTGIAVSTSTNAGGNPHKNIQPTIICNYIMRII